MFFSILIPVYNVEKYIKECLDSVVFQTFKDYECLLLDDGSTDNSKNICDEYAEKYGFKVFHKQNEGLMATRRFGLTKASGEYIINLDSDDKLALNSLETIYNYIIKYNADCVFYGAERFSDNEDVKYYPYSFKEEKLWTDKREFYLNILTNTENNSICRKAVKRKLVGKTDYSSFYNVSIGEDALQSLEIYKNCKSILTIKENLYYYRINNQSMMKDLSLKKFDTKFVVKEEVLNFLKGENVFDEKDFIVFRSSCVLNLVRILRGIAGSNATKKEKKKYFKDIKNSSYYKNFLSNGRINKKLVGVQYLGYFLFKINAYGLFIFLQKTFNKFKG